MTRFRNLPIKKKLVFIFTSFILIITGYLLLDKHFQKKRSAHNHTLSEVYQLEVDINLMLYYQNEFLLEGLIDPEFFETGTTSSLDKGDSLEIQIQEGIKNLKESALIRKDDQLSGQLEALNTRVQELALILDNVTEISLRRGFKQYGQEGMMRRHAHQIENHYRHLIEFSDLLLLRRHEKDYFLRKDKQYVDKFDAQHRHVIQSLDNKETPEVGKLLTELDKYAHFFHRIVDSEEIIGFKDKTGLRYDLEEANLEVNSNLESIKLITRQLSDAAMVSYDQNLRIGLIGYFSLLILLSLFLADRLTRRLRFVSESMNMFVESDFKKTTLFSKDIGKDEIGNLARNFQVLEQEISVHFKNFRESATRKEKEILRKNEFLKEAYTLIEQQNKDMLDSIKYAERIQSSILPSPKRITNVLEDHFVIYKPKDIVSGDFYWIEKVDGFLYICLADCTGHGVPGAFMSLIGHNHMNQAIFEKGLKQPNEILAYMNAAIMDTFDKNKKPQIVRDGMDMALVQIDLNTRQLSFAGAQRPLLILRNDEMIEFRGHRMPVGGFISSDIEYPVQKLTLEKGDQIYMFSDGYTDQFGGNKGKKFKTVQLKKLLHSIRHEPMNLQKELLEEAFELWKGDQSQIDDVCMVGFKA